MDNTLATILVVAPGLLIAGGLSALFIRKRRYESGVLAFLTITLAPVFMWYFARWIRDDSPVTDLLYELPSGLHDLFDSLVMVLTFAGLSVFWARRAQNSEIASGEAGRTGGQTIPPNEQSGDQTIAPSEQSGTPDVSFPVASFFIGIAVFALIGIGFLASTNTTSTPPPASAASTGEFMPFDVNATPAFVREVVEGARQSASAAEKAAADAQVIVKAAEGRASAARAGEKGTEVIESNYMCGLASVSGHYEGETLRGVANGHGVLVVTGCPAFKKTRTSGQFRQGQPHGLAAVEYEIWYLIDPADSDEISYEGNFQLGSRNGPGILKWRDGSKLAGNWENGTPRGLGIYYFKDGSRIEGEWRSGQAHGLAIQWDRYGKLQQAGRWDSGKFVSSSE